MMQIVSVFLVSYFFPYLPPVCEDNADGEDREHKYSSNTTCDQK